MRKRAQEHTKLGSKLAIRKDGRGFLALLEYLLHVAQIVFELCTRRRGSPTCLRLQQELRVGKGLGMVLGRGRVPPVLLAVGRQ